MEGPRLFRWFYRRFFDRMTVDERWAGPVRRAADRGIVVYVMRSTSMLDFLCLDYLVRRFDLPPLRFVNDLGVGAVEPRGSDRRRLRWRTRAADADALRQVVKAHESALLFVRRPPEPSRPAEREPADWIETIVEAQRTSPAPIKLVPQTFVWSKRPPNRRHTLTDLVLGSAEFPGRLRVLARFLLNHDNAHLRSGEPFDVGAFLRDHPELSQSEAADAIRYAVVRRIERERRVVLGPAKKTAARMRMELLRSPRVQKHIDAAVRERKSDRSDIVRGADRELRKLIADQDPIALGAFSRILDWVWGRIYAGVHVDRDGIERIRDAAKNGPLVLLPSHRSHIDYLVLSHVLGHYGVSPPLIAAGENLSFFPLGAIFRRGGAFFIRRQLQGRKLYTALVDAYMRKILAEGFNVEFFIEGGRSRTGKLLSPKLGLLSMVINAGLLLPRVRLAFVPISVAYERVVEEQAYAEELGGGEKQAESVGGLLRSARILASRYGRMHIQVGEIFSLDQLVEEVGASEAPKLRPSQRRALIRHTAQRISHQINRASVVTPSALVASAMLAETAGTMDRPTIRARASSLLRTLRARQARLAPSLDALPGALDDTLKLFVRTKLLSQPDGNLFHVPRAQRLRLEYHKNTVLHFFVPSALIALVMRAQRDHTIDEGTLEQSVVSLMSVFKHEFLAPEFTLEIEFKEARSVLVDAGKLTSREGRISVADEEAIALHASMLRSYVQAYHLSASMLVPGLPSKGLKRREWLRAAMAKGRKSVTTVLPEAVSRPKLDNALRAMHDHRLVRVSEDGVEPGSALSDGKTLKNYLHDLTLD